MSPSSEFEKILSKVPLLGNVLKSFRELIHFRQVFLVKRVLAENGLSNRTLFINFLTLVVLTWVVSFAWKFAAAGAIVTFTEPNAASILMFVLGVAICALFLATVLTCAALVVGTRQHAKGKTIELVGIPKAKNIFTPKGAKQKAPALEAPVLDKPQFSPAESAVRVSLPDSYPVRTSVLEGDETRLVGQLVNDVNALTAKGYYRFDEIWPELLSAYYLDYYIAQVRNGGHSQFTHNAQGNFEMVLEAVSNGLSKTRLPEVKDIFLRYKTWCEKNPKKVAEQTGFTGGRAPELDELDNALYGAVDQEEYPKPLAQWVSSWAFLTSCSENDYADAYAAMLDGNPDRGRRIQIVSLNKFREFFGSRERLGALLALKSADIRAILVSIQNGAYFDFDGEQDFAWRFRHSDGQGYLRVRENGYDFHPQIGDNSLPNPGFGASKEELSAAYEAYRTSSDKPRPGPVASHLSFVEIEALQSRLKDGAFADMIYATLSAAGIDANLQGLFLGRLPENGESGLVVLVGVETGRIFRVEIVTGEHCVLEEVKGDGGDVSQHFDYATLKEFVQELDGTRPAS